jgi:hypothetical protein
MYKKNWPHRICGWVIDCLALIQFALNIFNDTVWLGVILMVILFITEFAIDRLIFKWDHVNGYNNKS